MRLTRLRIKNFRSIGEVDVPIGPLTVLVGPNGAGKSNVVDALRFLRDALTRGLDQAILDRKGLAVICHWTGSKKAVDISLGVTYADGQGRIVTYDLTLSPGTRQGVKVKREELTVEVPARPLVRGVRQGTELLLQDSDAVETVQLSPDFGTTNKLIGPIDLPGPLYFANDAPTEELKQSPRPSRWHVQGIAQMAYLCSLGLTRSLFYTLNPKELRAPQRLVTETPFSEGGENLAAVLRHLHTNREDAREIKAVLSRLVSGVTDFSVETTGSFLVTYLHYLTASSKPRKSDLEQESDGTLRALGILAALFQPAQESHYPGQEPLPLRTIEEPEVNIHTGMLAVLAELFREASLRQQLILTTHSADLLDFLPPESFLMVERVNGETRVGPLATDQIEVVQRRLFTPGELLRAEGLHRQPDPVADAAE